jgi:hypothetical protein
MILESDIEGKAMEYAVAAGWLRAKIMRSYPIGFPDNFLVRLDRGIILMEFKRPKGDLYRTQPKRIRELRAAGVTVYVVKSLEEAKAILT